MSNDWVADWGYAREKPLPHGEDATSDSRQQPDDSLLEAFRDMLLRLDLGAQGS